MAEKKKRRQFSKEFRAEAVREEVQDGIWNILYYDTLLGRFDQRNKTITGAPSLRGKC